MPSFREFLTDSLVELCRIETIPTDNLKVTAGNEQKALDYIEKLLTKHAPMGIPEKMPIAEGLRDAHSYINPYYAESRNVYDNRRNLVHIWESSQMAKNGKHIGLNAHIDTIAPFIKPHVVDDIVFGRGACDDKGGCINIIAALRLLAEIGSLFKVYPGGRVTSMFVIDEETGGNGSLSLALDKELMDKINTMVVLEPTNRQIHPANRGALWYKIEVPADNLTKSILILLKVAIALERAGKKIKSESAHPLFPDKPVQTCQGIFGPYGEHPSRACDRIEFFLESSLTDSDMVKLIKQGLGKYLKEYGDKASAGRHYNLQYKDNGFQVTILGLSGHMAAASQVDNAIIKAAYIITGISKADKKLKTAFPDRVKIPSLILEGGQGFLPCHTLSEIENRLTDAVQAVINENCKESFPTPKISFNKLRNRAFAGDPESKSMVNAIFAAESVGIIIKKPISGFPASCDARLFAKTPGNIETITVGPGRLEDAHSNSEKIDIGELSESCAFLALYILIQTRAPGIGL